MAFSPRSKTTYGLPLRKESPTELTYDLKSFVRQAPHDERDKPPNTAQQRLWLDITHMDTSQLQQIDDDYNSNMWKNFKFVRPKHSANFATRKSVPSSAGISVVQFTSSKESTLYNIKFALLSTRDTMALWALRVRRPQIE
ncbi:hypothetical protein OS493_028559 [Desmophyllum pertusum]|uniref:Uncharacterized protein n=1 Tax=Desmophyllum pertusum TaxID=174260 RepID=A0A9X0CQW7_9CNID|nr:hypothetical protein OS493_028559 [Desmophyllum pertusum]